MRPLLASLALLLAACGPEVPAQRDAAPTAPAPAPTAPTPTPAAAPAASAPAHLLPAANPVRAQPLFADSLLPGPGRAAGLPLAGVALREGAATWSANPGIAFADDGATATAPGGAHHRIPAVAGTIRVGAEVRAVGSGFTGIALGRGDLSGNFWANNAILLLVRPGGYALMAGKANLIPHADPAVLRPGGADRLELEVDTVARTVGVRINDHAVLTAAALPSGVRVEGLDAAGFRCNEPIVAGKPRVSAWRCSVASAATAGLVPVDHAMCFVDPDRPAVLRWAAAASGPDTRVPYAISDYRGRRVAAGDALLGADGLVTLERAFARGWYEVAFPAAHQAFGVVALEAHAGEADPFFGMDAGLSWLETDPARRDALIRILARCGIGIARERLGLGAINPAPGTWNWDPAPRRFDSLRRTYAAHGVSILEMLHGGAQQHRMLKDIGFASDFPRLAESDIAQEARWKAVWSAVEVENEPDLKAVPAEQYAAVAKATSWAMRRAGSAAPVVTGVVGGMPPGAWFDAAAANGLLDDSDVFSFHSYDRAASVETMVGRYRAWLAKAGHERLPLWHSECGWPWAKGPDRAPLDQDQDSAAEIAAKAVESLACGVARHFPFVYVHYEEGPKCFGMMGREATPLRSMAAYAMAVHALSGRRYLGDLAGVEGAALARVFAGADGEPLVTMLYAGPPKAGATARLPLAPLRAAGADGRALAADGTTVALEDGLAWVWLDPAAAAPHLRTDTAAARLWALGREPERAQRRAAPIILQFLAADLHARASARRYLIAPETAKALPLRVRLQNLADAAITVHPALTLPGAAAIPAEPVAVPANGEAEVAWTVDASAALDIAATRLVTVIASIDGGAQPTPLAIPLVVEGGLEQHLARHARQRPLPITDLSRWQENHAGQGSSTFAADGGTWRLSDRFPGDTGNWDYPKFRPDRAIDPAREDGFVIRGRVLHAAGNVALMANPNQADGFWCNDIFPADGAWHVAYIPFAELVPGPNGAGMQNSRLDPASWKTLALGMGSRVAENTLEISHFLVVGE